MQFSIVSSDADFDSLGNETVLTTLTEDPNAKQKEVRNFISTKV